MPHAILEKEKDRIAVSLAGAYGSSLLSLFVYGSAATPDYQPGVSDINLAVVLLRDDLDTIRRGSAVIEQWAERGVKCPFFFTRQYLENSADAFPIEILNMKEEHLVIYGDDPLTGVQIGRNHLRLQAERELKGKALHVRGFYAAHAQKKETLDALLQVSAREFIAIFKALVFLKSGAFPHGRQEALTRVRELYQTDVSLVQEILSGSYRAGGNYDTLFKQYVAAIDGMAQEIDALKITP